jgi:hypothetical protein
MPRLPHVQLFTRAQCTLCDGVNYIIKRVQKSIPFHYSIVDIAAPENQKWLQLYDYDIPVVHLNEVEISRHRLSEEKLRTELEKVIRESKSTSPINI